MRIQELERGQQHTDKTFLLGVFSEVVFFGDRNTLNQNKCESGVILFFTSISSVNSLAEYLGNEEVSLLKAAVNIVLPRVASTQSFANKLLKGCEVFDSKVFVSEAANLIVSKVREIQSKLQDPNVNSVSSRFIVCDIEGVQGGVVVTLNSVLLKGESGILVFDLTIEFDNV